MKKILIVSSSPVFVQRNKHLLERADFLIHTATSGQKALKLHESIHIDLIISELKLSDMMGDKLCQLFRSESVHSEVPFILIYRDSISDEHERAQKSGATALVPRPIQPEYLLKVVGEALNVQILRPKRVTINVKVLVKKNTMRFNCTSNNISIMGILLESDRHLDQQDRIICQFAVPNFSEIRVEGVVMRSVKKINGEFQLGIRFIDLPLNAKNDIEKFVDSISHEV